MLGTSLTLARVAQMFGRSAQRAGEPNGVNLAYDVGDIRRYGAVSGGGDCVAAINRAVTAVTANPGLQLVIPEGVYNASTKIVLNLPDRSNVLWLGRIRSSVAGDTAVQIGPTAGATGQWYTFAGGIDIERTALDVAGSSVGLEFRNVSNGKFIVKRIYGFHENVLVNSTYAGGTGYNQFHLGWMIDGVTTLRLAASNGGFTNENNFFGGSWSRTSTFLAAAPGVATVNLVVDYYAVNVINNNRFYSPSFEDNSVNAKAAVIEGQFILIFHPRMENTALPNTYPIEFGTHSQECQIIGRGAGLSYGCIVDNGTANSYETRRGQAIASYGAAATEPIIDVMSLLSSGAYAFASRDSAKTIRFWVRCDGIGNFDEYCHFEKGIRWQRQSPGDVGRGLFPCVGTPNGTVTARTGSLAINPGGGAGAVLWVKETGDMTNTGWVAVKTI